MTYKSGDKVICIKGQNKGMVGIVSDQFDNYVYVNFPDRAKKGKNTEVSVGLNEIRPINESNVIELIRRIIKEERQKLKELSTNDEIEHLATNLLDYLGGSIEDLPNWRADSGIVKYFRDNSISGNLASKVYQRALELSQDNATKPKSTNKRYLDN